MRKPFRKRLISCLAAASIMLSSVMSSATAFSEGNVYGTNQLETATSSDATEKQEDTSSNQTEEISTTEQINNNENTTDVTDTNDSDEINDTNINNPDNDTTENQDTTESEIETSEDITEDSTENQENSQDSEEENQDTSEQEADDTDSDTDSQDDENSEKDTSDKENIDKEKSDKKDKDSEIDDDDADIMNSEEGLYLVMSEKVDNVKLSVYSASKDSDIKLSPLAVDVDREGLEIIKGYKITGRNTESDVKEDSNDSNNNEVSNISDDNGSTLWVKVEPAGSMQLKDSEKVALYSAANKLAAEPVIEDISEDNGLCRIGDDVSGIALVKDTGYRHINIELRPEDADSLDTQEENKEEAISEAICDNPDEAGLTDGSENSNDLIKKIIKKDNSEEIVEGSEELFNSEKNSDNKNTKNKTVKKTVKKTDGDSKTDTEDKNDKEETRVVLDGIMPTDATAEAVDVTGERQQENEDADTASVGNAISTVDEATSDSMAVSDDSTGGKGVVVAAFDITIRNGEEEYQPDKTRPIKVEITDYRITKSDNLQLWHIKDNGEREEVKDFTIEDGKVSFDAEGFSVYEIVQGLPTHINGGWHKLKSLADIQTYANKGIYISSTAADNGGYHFVTNYQTKITEGRYGITKTKGAYNVAEGINYEANGAITDSELFKAVPFYFEDFSISSDNKTGTAKIYCYDENGSKQYIKNDPVDSMVYVTDSNQADTFTIRLSNNTFSLQGKTNYFNEQGAAAWGGGTDKDGVKKSFAAGDKATNLYLYIYDDLSNDAYQLNGKTFGLLYYSNSVGNALMADRSGNVMSMRTNVIRNGNKSKPVFISEDNVTSWTFHKSTENKYYISTLIGSEVKYLKINGNNITLSDTIDGGTEFTVYPDTDNKIKLFSNGKYIIFDGTSFKVGTDAKKAGLNFIDIADINTNDKVTYFAKKVSVSEVPDGEMVIVYTRVWDNTKKSYDFYAIDYDGTVFQCYERGDNIMWIGRPIDTFEWEFTEYTYDDGSSNSFYELQNSYSKVFIAPQVKNGQVLSNTKIGINMEGRGYNQYYSTIVAWDDPNYAYAGLRVVKKGNKMVLESCPMGEADTFYFASVKDAVPTLTEVETIDNTQYGITMKIIDFEKRSDQSNFLGDDSGGAVTNTVPGLLSTNIPEGSEYPVTAYETSKVKKDKDFDPDVYVKGKSLGDLFAGSYEVNNLFIKSTYEATGYFEFDSTQNFASLQGNKFKVYKELGTNDLKSSNSMKHGQFMPFNTITPGKYAVTNPQNLYDSLLKSLSNDDPRKYENLHLIDGTSNYYNGVELKASFVQTPNGKDAWGHDIIFEFTGDDDFWLYVDNELVIDLGGIHSALAGNVNFATGEVNVNNKKTTLRQVFRENYISRNPNATETEINNYLSEYFAENEDIFKDYTSHTMRIFYMERGAGASNLHMRFNLSYVTPGHVVMKKEVTGSDDIDFKLVEYPYQIWYINEENGEPILLTSSNEHISVNYQNSTERVKYMESYTPPNCTTPYRSVFFLHPDKAAEIHFPSDAIMYKIIECGINQEVYDHVYVNEQEIDGESIGNTNRRSYDSGWISVADRPSVKFENHVDSANLRTLYFKKRLLDEAGNPLQMADDSTLFSFRLYLSNDVDDTLSYARAAKYCVQDPEGYLCTWDSEHQRFQATQYKDLAELKILPEDTEEQIREKNAVKNSITFNTSFNGSISKIPAYYTVLVPNLLVGSRFKVEEKFNEIPVGYGRTEYHREEGSYIPAEDGALNAGRIRKNESPRVDITNKRGYGIEVDKVWSDQKYTKSHDPIYFAVYVGDSENPLPETVRVLTSRDKFVRYFFDGLLPERTLNDYHVYEVEVTDPGTPDDDGKISTYTDVKKILADNSTTINAVPSSSDTDTPQPFDYVVTYDEGTPYPCRIDFPVENARTDTVTNTRSGGVTINLYDMKTRNPLSGGTFILKKSGEQKALGTFSADSEGRITILYDFEPDVEYILEETIAPKGYIGLPNEIKFSVNDQNVITVDPNGNGAEWQNGEQLADNPEKLIAKVNVYNKPYNIHVYKYDKDVGESNGKLEGAKFALYKGVKSGLGEVIKNSSPMQGYENLITDSDGIIPNIDNQLEPGRYFLSEIAPPLGYKGLKGDVVFEITEKNGLKHISSPVGSDVVVEESNSSDNIQYLLKIPNNKDNVSLTITKKIAGNMGNKAKEFTFTFAVTGETEASSSEYIWFKNGTEQTTPLKSGNTFTLGHDDSVVITIPADKEITISENAESYNASFKLGDGTAEETSSKTFTISEDTELVVTNTKESILPTGVETHLLLLILSFFGIIVVLTLLILNNRKLKREQDT